MAQPVATIAAPPAPPVSVPGSVPLGPNQATLPAQPPPRPAYQPIEVRRDTDWLLLVRLVSALSILAISIMGLIVATEHNPPSWLSHWMLNPPTKSSHSFKVETIFLIVLASIAILSALARFSAPFFALLMSLTLMGIVTGNILDWGDLLNYKAWAAGMTQTNFFITTWICLGLGLICVLSAGWVSATRRQLVGVLTAGTVITGGTVAILAALAPTLVPGFGAPF